MHKISNPTQLKYIQDMQVRCRLLVPAVRLIETEGLLKEELIAGATQLEIPPLQVYTAKLILEIPKAKGLHLYFVKKKERQPGYWTGIDWADPSSHDYLEKLADSYSRQDRRNLQNYGQGLILVSPGDNVPDAQDHGYLYMVRKKMSIEEAKKQAEEKLVNDLPLWLGHRAIFRSSQSMSGEIIHRHKDAYQAKYLDETVTDMGGLHDPDRIYTNEEGEFRSMEWHKKGERHRTTGPANIEIDDGIPYGSWCLEGWEVDPFQPLLEEPNPEKVIEYLKDMNESERSLIFKHIIQPAKWDKNLKRSLELLNIFEASAEA